MTDHKCLFISADAIESAMNIAVQHATTSTYVLADAIADSVVMQQMYKRITKQSRKKYAPLNLISDEIIHSLLHMGAIFGMQIGIELRNVESDA